MASLARDERGSPAAPRLRVLMVAHEWFDDNPGGAGRYLADVARGLARRGHAVDVLVPATAAAAPGRYEVDGVALHRLAIGHGAARWIAGLARGLGAFVAAQGPFDVVHSHFAPIGLVPLWHPALARARRVCQFQGPWAAEAAVEGAGRLSTAAKHLIEKLAYARCGRFVTLSQAFADVLVRDYGVAGERIRVVPAAVDVARFAPAADREALRASLGHGPGPVVFTARRLVRRMGLDVLLDAWARVHAVRPDASLQIAGRGPLADELAARAAALGLGESVRFLGRIDDDQLVACYRAADLVVVPTVALEGFGLITVESLACGTPVVGTTAGATPEILGPLDPRLLVPPGDAEALGGRIVELLAGPGARPDRTACREYVLARYTWATVLARLEGVLADG